MQKILMILLLATSAGVMAQPLVNGQVIPLWQGMAPGSEKITAEEKIVERSKDPARPNRIYTQVSKPTLTACVPDKPSGVAMIIAPGGGKDFLVVDKESGDICQWLNSIGITGFLLKYRTYDPQQEKPEDMQLQDGQRAVRVLRHHTADWGLDPQRIGMIGFSAGGLLTAMTAMYHQQSVYPPADVSDQLGARPDFIVMGYAAASRLPWQPALPMSWHKEKYKIHKDVVTKNSPPAFLFHAQDDKNPGAPPVASLLVYDAYLHAEAPAELHIFAKGGHGFGLRDAKGPVAQWPRLCADWMETIGILRK